MKKTLALILALALMLSLCAFGVGAVTYTDWTDATTLPTDGAYKLTTDVTVDAFAGVSIMNGKTVTLDLNGHTVTFNNGYYYVRSGGTLIINDSVGTGKIINVGGINGAIYANGSGAYVEINGGTIENKKDSGYAVYVNAGATGVLNYGTIENLADTNGYAVYVNGASSFTMNDGAIKNSDSNSGRAVYVNGAASFTMEDGEVTSLPNGDSAAIQGNGSGAITVNGGDITAGTTGGIAISSSSNPVTITGGDIEAGKNALQTRYATVEPAAGSTVNITAGAAILWPYSAPTDGSDGNVLKGGNFEAPALTTSSNSDNAVVDGGTYTDASGAALDVSSNLAPGATAGANGTVTPCAHTTTELKYVMAATCVSSGYTGDEVCTACEKTVQSGTTANPTGVHTPGEVKADGGAHWDVCGACGTYENFEDHADGNGDGRCDVCGWTMNARPNPSTGVKF